MKHLSVVLKRDMQHCDQCVKLLKNKKYKGIVVQDNLDAWTYLKVEIDGQIGYIDLTDNMGIEYV